MSAVASELALLRREVARLRRQMGQMRMAGKVHEVKSEAGDWRVRLDFGEDPESGRKVLSPWVRVQPASAGALKIKIRPSEGEQMYLMSAAGVVGADSLAQWGAYDQDHPAPAGEEDVVIERGGARLTIADGRIVATVGDASITIADGKVTTKAESIVADGTLKLGSPDAARRALRDDLSPAEKVYVT